MASPSTPGAQQHGARGFNYILGKIHAIPQLPGHQESRGRVPALCSPSLPGCLSLTVSWARCSPRHLPEQSSSPRVAVPSILVPFL